MTHENAIIEALGHILDGGQVDIFFQGRGLAAQVLHTALDIQFEWNISSRNQTFNAEVIALFNGSRHATVFDGIFGENGAIGQSGVSAGAGWTVVVHHDAFRFCFVLIALSVCVVIFMAILRTVECLFLGFG